MQPNKILIVGSSSNVALNFDKLFGTNHVLIPSGRNSLFPLDLLDLQFPSDDQLKDISHAVICAGVSNILLCEKDYHTAYLVNVSSTIRLIDFLNQHNISCLFLSSSAVFSNDALISSEFSLKDPSTSYGYFKSLVEDHMLQSSLNTVVRFPKVLSLQHGILRTWLVQMRINNVIHAFHDLHVAPLSYLSICSFINDWILNSSIFALQKIIHLSPDEDISYYKLALYLAQLFDLDSALVSKSETALSDSEILFKPRIANLNCTLPLSRQFKILEETLRIVNDH